MAGILPGSIRPRSFLNLVYGLGTHPAIFNATAERVRASALPGISAYVKQKISTRRSLNEQRLFCFGVETGIELSA
jgi:hypothetical protein